MRRIPNTNLLFWVNLPKRLQSLVHSVKCKTSVYVLTEICLQWTKRLSPKIFVNWSCFFKAYFSPVAGDHFSPDLIGVTLLLALKRAQVESLGLNLGPVSSLKIDKIANFLVKILRNYLNISIKLITSSAIAGAAWAGASVSWSGLSKSQTSTYISPEQVMNCLFSSCLFILGYALSWENYFTKNGRKIINLGKYAAYM